MRVKSKMNLQIYEDTDEVNALYAPDDEAAEVITDEFAEATWGRFLIAASGTFTIPFGTVTACRGFKIWSLGDISVNLNALGNLSLSLPPNASTGTPCRLQIEGTVSSVVLTNPSSSTPVEGRWALYGDAT